MTRQDAMDVYLRKNENFGMQFYPEIKLYFVVSGALTITVKDSSWRLCKDQFFLVNAGLVHSMKSETPDTILCCVTFSCRIIAEMSGEESNLFYCSSVDEKDLKYHEMRRILHELIHTQVQQMYKTECMKYSVLYKLLNCLLESFRLDMETAKTADADDLKMLQIMQYINQNYAYTVSLTELADRLFLSKSTLSRFFKKQTGVYFADYVNQVRLKYAVEDLIYSNKNITKIAVDNGFSNPSAFNKLFREQYDLSPSEYRANFGQQSRPKQDELQEDKEFREELKEKLTLERGAVPDTVSIRTSIGEGTSFPKVWDECINIGSAYNLSIANLQYHTLYLKEQLGFRYARIWSIFSQKLTISDGRHIGWYNYDRIDVVLDFLVSNHIRPFMDFGNRPDTAVYSPGNPIFCDVEYIQFESKDVWKDLFRDFILHITNRYGEKEVSGWIFEFSFDTTHAPERDYYKDEAFDYFDTFSYAYSVIKGRLPDAQIGGPMSEAELNYSFTSEFLNFCRENHCFPDFVSFMLFPYHTNRRGQESETVRAATARSESEQVEMMHHILEESGASDCKIYVTEWNDTLSNRNYLNDSCSRAAYIAKKVAEVADEVDMLCIWMASDWMSSYYDTVCITNGGSGILTKDSIRKPAYFALEFLHRMGTTLIDKGTDYIITEKRNGEYYILCFNYKWFGVNYFLEDESIREPERLYEIFEDTHLMDLEFYLENIQPAKEYIIKRRTINEESGSLLMEWKNFQYDKKLRSSDIKYIRECCIPKVSMTRAEDVQGALYLHVTLKPHEVSLIHIYEED